MKKIFLIIIGLFQCINLFAQGICDRGDCAPVPKPDPKISLEDFANMQLLIEVAVDPNELDGPRGIDSVRWVSVNDILNYTIFFENDPVFATAHAQIIDVSCEFPYKQLMDKFVLGNYCFANKSYTIPSETSFYSMRLDERDSLSIFVDILAGLDIEKKTAFWKLSSIDPETGYAPWEVDRGILPVNDSTHVGEGFVTFRIKPLPTMQTGDTISMFANIVFDSNDTIATNRWCNMIDAGAPTSTIKFDTDTADYSHYLLRFEAEDDKDGSGVKKVDVYLADIWGNYVEYASCTADSVIDLYIEKGREYKLYSIAEDRVGNREPIKLTPDLVLNFNMPPTDILLSNSMFQDDIADDGYIGEFSTVDTEENQEFTYTLADGDGAIHNEMFAVVGNKLQANDCFKCSDDTVFHIRVSTTDVGGLSFSKAFTLSMKNVFEKPMPDTLNVHICEDGIFTFKDEVYDKAGIYYYRKSNELMCDSVYVINLAVSPIPEKPEVSVSDVATLTSSSEKGNQWFKDGEPIAGATEKVFTPVEDGVYYVAVSNGACYSEPSDAYKVLLSDEHVLTLNLAKGWNWISSNIDGEECRNVTKFVQPIESSIERLLSFKEEVIRDPQMGLTGNLKLLSPVEGYMVQTNDFIENSWTGKVCDPASATVTLKKGWNWIGYVPVYSNSLDKALAGLSPNEGDVIKDYYDFSTFHDGKWSGTLTTMSPGCGYMYYTAIENSFVYPSYRAFNVQANVDPQRVRYYSSKLPWKVEANAYPYNMSVIAKVYSADGEIPAGLYTIGAFSGNECRGVGKYIDDRLFMTIYGYAAESDKIVFKAYDNSTQEEYDIAESTFFGNEMLGSMSSPFKLTVSDVTGINDAVADKYNIYPNPVRNVLYVHGDLNGLISVKVISPNGAVVAQTDSYTENGLNVSSIFEGAYIVVLETEKGVVIKRIIKVN